MFALIWVRQVGGMGYQFGLKKPRCYTYDNAQTDQAMALLSNEYLSAKYNLHSLSEGNSYSLGPLPLRLSIAKGTIFLNWEHNLLASQYL